MGICALCVFLLVVKHFEILKALYKFPIIIIHKPSNAWQFGATMGTPIQSVQKHNVSTKDSLEKHIGVWGNPRVQCRGHNQILHVVLRGSQGGEAHGTQESQQRQEDGGEGHAPVATVVVDSLQQQGMQLLELEWRALDGALGWTAAGGTQVGVVIVGGDGLSFGGHCGAAAPAADAVTVSFRCQLYGCKKQTQIKTSVFSFSFFLFLFSVNIICDNQQISLRRWANLPRH